MTMIPFSLFTSVLNPCLIDQTRKSDFPHIIINFNDRCHCPFAEAERMEKINNANGEAAAMVAIAEARAKGLNLVSKSLTPKEGKNAASLYVAEQYVAAFNKLARTNNTLILPSNVGDITSLVASAMTMYGTISKVNDRNQAIEDESTAISTIADNLLVQSTPTSLPSDASMTSNKQSNSAKAKDLHNLSVSDSDKF